MFCFTPPHMHQCFSNPFGATMLNPKINFCLGMAAATSPMSMYGVPFGGSLFMPYSSMMGFNSYHMMPAMPTFGFGFNNTNNLTGFNTLNNNYNFNSFAPVNNFGTDLNSYMALLTKQMQSSFKMPNFSFNPYLGAATNNSNDINDIDPNEPQGVKLNKDKSKYGPEFLEKVKQIAKRINCNYRDLLAIMNSESGIDAQAKNSNGSATGLIQFIESTARTLGTTTAALRNMSPIQQLDYVEKYFIINKTTAGFSASDKLSAGELYALVFLPARAKREILTTSDENFYNANKALDKNNDGKITKDELAQRVQSHYVSDSTFLA